MIFLSQTTTKLLNDFLPLLGHMANNRITNYLSFYLSHTGKHLYHSKDLASKNVLKDIFQGNYQKKGEVGSGSTGSIEHLLAKKLLSTEFYEHVVDEDQVWRMHDGLLRLKQINKQDIIEQFLKSRCMIKDERQILVKNEIAPTQRRNIYVYHDKQLPVHSELYRIMRTNPFYSLSNLNKILVFNSAASHNLHLPDQIEQYCQKNSIRIKLLKTNTFPELLQYIYARNKRNILIHQTINNYRDIYDLKTNESKLKIVDGNVINRLDLRLMPRQIVMFTQRLPQESVVFDKKDDIMSKMRILLNRGKEQGLIDVQNGLTFNMIEKNYLNEDIEGETVETKHGFSMRRYVTEKVYQQNRKQEVIPYSPYAKDNRVMSKSKKR